jgi:DNA invertase Pin-like site-specific DNA recombinase
MRIGCARVSRQHQNLGCKIGALRPERVDKPFTENKASGNSVKDRPQLEKAIDLLGKRDTLVVADWDRAARSMLDGIELVERINARGHSSRCRTDPISISRSRSGGGSSPWFRPRTSASASPGARTTAERHPGGAARTCARSPR